MPAMGVGPKATMMSPDWRPACSVGAGFLDVVDHDGGVDGKLVFVDEAAGQGDVLAGDADPAAAHAAVEQELGGDELGGVDADGEADALRGRDDRRC